MSEGDVWPEVDRADGRGQQGNLSVALHPICYIVQETRYILTASPSERPREVDLTIHGVFLPASNKQMMAGSSMID